MSILGELTLLFLLICLGFSVYYIYKEKYINKTKMSFKESLDLVGVPIVTFYQFGNKYNFLLDSGAAINCINKDIISTINYSKTKLADGVIGLDGIKHDAEIINVNLFYKDNSFNTNFAVVNMTETLAEIKQSSGVTVCGILGTEFLSKYKYVMDFKDNIAYIK